MKIVISSGHGKYVRGASGILDEVDEARQVVEAVAVELRRNGHEVTTFHDDTSHDQSTNLETIVDFHNEQDRDVDVSVHFNCYEQTSKPMGCEVLYVTQEDLAMRVSRTIATAGKFIDRGPKYRSDLYFLNNTEMPAILLEVCFVDSASDAELYKANFDTICKALGDVPLHSDPEPPPFSEIGFHAEGPCSWFGGPNDTGVSPSEGLAFFYDYSDAPHLFLDEQPPNTTGLARRLDPNMPYVACRWDYGVTPKEMLDERNIFALVRANGKECLAWPADWGPHEDTGRVADLSPLLMSVLELETDDVVEIIYPWGRR